MSLKIAWHAQASKFRWHSPNGSGVIFLFVTFVSHLFLLSEHTTVGSDDRQIPLLRDVFDNFPGMPINIDIKIDDDELINKVRNFTV